MSNVKVAKLFKNGGSQAVHLSAEFQFEGDEVYISRDERTGNVILSQTSREAFWDALFATLDAGKTEDADLDAYMAERPMNVVNQRVSLFVDDE